MVKRHGQATKQFNIEIVLGLSLVPMANAPSFCNMIKPIAYILQKLEHTRLVLFKVIGTVAMQENTLHL